MIPTTSTKHIELVWSVEFSSGELHWFIIQVSTFAGEYKVLSSKSVHPEPIVINGVLTYNLSKMAENKWVTGVSTPININK